MHYRPLIIRSLPAFLGACLAMLAIFIATTLNLLRSMDYCYLAVASVRIVILSIGVGLLSSLAPRTGILARFLFGLMAGPFAGWACVALTTWSQPYTSLLLVTHCR